MAAVVSPAHALTQEELAAKLKTAGYLQVQDVKSNAEGTSAKVMKNGEEVILVIDSQWTNQRERSVTLA